MNNALTKIWFFLVLGIVLALSLFISFFLFIAVLIITLITVPYLWYIQWKAKKEFEKMNVEYRVIKIKELGEKIDEKNDKQRFN